MPLNGVPAPYLVLSAPPREDGLEADPSVFAVREKFGDAVTGARVDAVDCPVIEVDPGSAGTDAPPPAAPDVDED